MKELSECKVIIVGNAANGNLGHNFKKFEVCLVCEPFINASYSNSHIFFEKIAQILEQNCQSQYKGVKLYYQDKRLLIKAYDLENRRQIYIGFNNIMNVLTTNLISLYNQIDVRFHKIGCFLR